MIKRLGDKGFYEEQKKKVLEQEKLYNHKDVINVWLSLPLSEISHTDLYKKIKKIFPKISDNMTLGEIRTMKLFEKIFVESSMKAMELSFKLDGSFSDLTKEKDLSDVEEVIGGIE